MSELSEMVPPRVCTRHVRPLRARVRRHGWRRGAHLLVLRGDNESHGRYDDFLAPTRTDCVFVFLPTEAELPPRSEWDAETVVYTTTIDLRHGPGTLSSLWYVRSPVATRLYS